MKYLLERIKDILAIICAVIFQLPTTRLDKIVGSEEEKYTGTIGSTAVVTEIVSATAGTVRYSGVLWRARLSESSVCTSINIGEAVTIEAAEGNVLIVVQLAGRRNST